MQLKFIDVEGNAICLRCGYASSKLGCGADQ